MSKPKNLPTLEQEIQAIIQSHTRGSANDEWRLIYCSSSCLAKEIARKVHADIEAKL